MINRIKEFSLFFWMQILSYSMVCFSFRAVAQAHYAASVGVDIIYASLTFFVLRKIAKSEDTLIAWAGYTAGSAVGTALGIWVSQVILGR
jgi:hypothetical protein